MLHYLRKVAGLGRTITTAASSSAAASTLPKLPLHTGRDRVVCLGTGWGGARLIHDLDPKKYDITIISPRNHMIFTPLLSSTCVGTLETRAVTLPIIDLQPALRQPQNYYFAATAVAVHPQDRLVEACSEDGIRFFAEYDVLVIATGSQGSTFGIPGVEEFTHFLRDASHSTAIRNKLIMNWNRANIPGRPLTERDRLLHTVVVGGGPTGVEFAGELSDFISRDLKKIDPDRALDMRITLIEANELLGSFDARLREYTARQLVKEGVHLVKGVVKEVRETELELQDGSIVPFGLCVWSTGVGPTPFTLSLPFTKTSRGRLAVDERLRVMAPPPHSARDKNESDNGDGVRESGPRQMSDVSIVQEEEPPPVAEEAVAEPLPNVFALGDCCANSDTPLPALAQVAEQQGKYLARVLNMRARQAPDAASAATNAPPKFVYRSLGSMATVGGRKAVIELQSSRSRFSWAGLSSWVAWRSAYLTRLGTVKARLYVMTNWTLTLLFGRDISRW